MSNNKTWKDNWIKDAIRKRYLVVREDGTIFRCTKADEDGNLGSEQYRKVAYRTHPKSGRVYFNLTWRGFTKSVLVNRIVALRFLPNSANLEQVNHIDGDKGNNALSNLEWISASDNERHAHRTGLKSGRGSGNSNAKLCASDVLAIRASQKRPFELADEFGVGRSTITNILAGRTWTHV